MTAVLVVEDEPLTASAGSCALAEAGYEVETAACAEDAYAKLATEPRSFDAVVTDVNLGPGDHGFAVAARARLLNPAVQVAFMTGRPENLGVFDPAVALMFSKPFDPEELVHQLAMLVPL